MNGKNFTSSRIWLISIIAIALLNVAVYAQEVPALPAFFYGKATINGRNVPVDSLIIAKIDNEKSGQIKVTTAGLYGSATTQDKIGVSGTRSSLGKDIQFYAKVPGLKEIKAAQTSQWQPGSETKLDLTFNGEEIVDNSTAVNETEELQAFGNKESFLLNSIIAGKQIAVFLTNPNIPILRLQLITNKNLTNVSFEFEVVDVPEAPKVDGVYKYIKITAPKIEDDFVKTAIIRFKVSNEWLDLGYDPEKVTMLRYHNNKWEELETVREGADETDNYYRSSTPGFSYFAIKSEKLKSEPKALELDAKEQQSQKKETVNDKDDEPAKKSGTNEAQDSGVNKITGLVVEKVKSNPIIGVAMLLVGVFLGILMTYFFVLRKKSE